MYKLVTLYHILLLCSKNVHAATLQNMEDLQKYVLNSTRYIKPRLNQSLPVNIDIRMLFGSIQDYDEISGTLTFTASFEFRWTDETKTWTQENFGGIIATNIPACKTWIPTLLLRNGVTGFTLYQYDNDVHAENALVAYQFSGRAVFRGFGQYDVTCESDVTYYPFDEHTCSIIAMASDILNDLNLTSNYGISFALSMPNIEWRIESNASYTRRSTFESFGDVFTQDQFQFILIIRRQSLFPLLNIVLPVILLSLVFLLVFLLPVESGERTSFSFTLQLTLVVFMTMVADRLPASNNISIFNIFLVSQLFTSILVTVFVVLGIRLFYKDLNDKKLNIFYQILLKLYEFSYKDIIYCKNKVENKEENSETFTQRIPSSKALSAFYDRICLWLFCFGFVCYFLVYGLIFHFR